MVLLHADRSMATACVHMIVYSGVHAWPSAGYIRTYVLNLQALQQLGTWHIDLCLRFIDRLHAVVESAELCDEHAVILYPLLRRYGTLRICHIESACTEPNHASGPWPLDRVEAYVHL